MLFTRVIPPPPATCPLWMSGKNARERRRIRRRDFRLKYHTDPVKKFAPYEHRIYVDGSFVCCATPYDAENLIGTAMHLGKFAVTIDPYAVRAYFNSYVPKAHLADYFRDFGEVSMIRSLPNGTGGFVVDIVFMDRIGALACFNKSPVHTVYRKRCLLAPVPVQSPLDVPKPWSPARLAR